MRRVRGSQEKGAKTSGEEGDDKMIRGQNDFERKVSKGTKTEFLTENSADCRRWEMEIFGAHRARRV